MNYTLHFSTAKGSGERLITAKDSNKKVLGRAAHPDAAVALRNLLVQVDPQLAVGLGADPKAVLSHVLESQ